MSEKETTLPPELEAEWKAIVKQEAEQQEYVPTPKGYVVQTAL